MRIFGEEYNVNAGVESIEGYSAHADQQGLLAWAETFDRQRLQQLFLVHGEPDAMHVLAGKLHDDGVAKVAMPTRGDHFIF